MTFEIICVILFIYKNITLIITKLTLFKKTGGFIMKGFLGFLGTGDNVEVPSDYVLTNAVVKSDYYINME